jgi:hypothetical protein
MGRISSKLSKVKKRFENPGNATARAPRKKRAAGRARALSSMTGMRPSIAEIGEFGISQIAEARRLGAAIIFRPAFGEEPPDQPVHRSIRVDHENKARQSEEMTTERAGVKGQFRDVATKIGRASCRERVS